MNTQRYSIGREDAIKLSETRWWEGKTSREIAGFQLFVEELCCPFEIFHNAVEDSLGRPVWTHEFGLSYDLIVAEFNGDRASPTMQEIVNMIPEHKRIVVVR